jgi:nucleoside phosphorylase
MVDSALGAQAVLGEERPGRVWLVGSCGAYAGAGLGLGAVVVASEVVVVDAGEALGVSESVTAPVRLRPALLPPDGLWPGGTLHEGAPSGPVHAAVATTLGVTVDDDAAATLRRFSGAAVEHMEAFAVARACESFGVPWGVVLGVANAVGRNARSEWRARHARAERAAARAAVELDAALSASGR